MTQDIWSKVDQYHEDLLVKSDQRFTAVIENSIAAGLPEIRVSAAQGKLLELLARFQQAERILEVGTLGGYSTA